MNDGFPDGGIGVLTTDPDPLSEAAFADYESSFRSAMSSYHMAANDITCMVEQALQGPSPDATGLQLSWTAEELDQFAADCDVNFAELYYMTD